MDEKLARAARWDKRLKEKLTEVLEGQLTQVVIYLGCCKDQWNRRSKSKPYVVLRGVILEQ